LVDRTVDLESRREAQLVGVALADGRTAVLDEPRVLSWRVPGARRSRRRSADGRLCIPFVELAREGVRVRGEEPYAARGMLEGDVALRAHPVRGDAVSLGHRSTGARRALLVDEPADPSAAEGAAVTAVTGITGRAHDGAHLVDVGGRPHAEPAPAFHGGWSRIQPEEIGVPTSRAREQPLGLAPRRAHGMKLHPSRVEAGAPRGCGGAHPRLGP